MIPSFQTWLELTGDQLLLRVHFCQPRSGLTAAETLTPADGPVRVKLHFLMGKQLTSRTGTLPGSRSDPVCQLDVGEKDAGMGRDPSSQGLFRTRSITRWRGSCVGWGVGGAIRWSDAG